jgi:hypothetical protein
MEIGQYRYLLLTVRIYHISSGQKTLLTKGNKQQGLQQGLQVNQTAKL